MYETGVYIYGIYVPPVPTLYIIGHNAGTMVVSISEIHMKRDRGRGEAQEHLKLYIYSIYSLMVIILFVVYYCLLTCEANTCQFML